MIARNRRHGVLLAIWMIVYSFVAIQMSWVLRPFIGQPTLETHSFDRPRNNAYVVVARCCGIGSRECADLEQ